MRCAMVVMLGLAACGRLGFDPLGGDSAPASDGAPATGDGAPSIDSSSGMIDAQLIDAPPAACAQAITINLGRTGPTSTCTLPDVIDSCAATAKQEVVFKFIAPSNGGYTMAARNPGTANVSNSTQILDASCTALPGCAGITGRSFTAGQVVYLVVEASSAACAMIEYEITSP